MSEETKTSLWRQTIIRVLSKNYTRFLVIIGISGFGDLCREYFRSKLMDWGISKLGRFGEFIVGNPMALTCIGIVIAMLVLTRLVVSESSKEVPSLIYEHRDKKFTKPAPSRKWLIGFVAVMSVLILAVCVGTYKYWTHLARRSGSQPTAISEPINISNQPIAAIPPSASSQKKERAKPTNKITDTGSASPQTLPQQPQSAAQSNTSVPQKQELSQGDRERLADALFEFAQILDEANAAWGKANRIKIDEKGPFIKDLATRKSKIPEAESAAKEFERHFSESRQKWKYYRPQIVTLFGDNPDNNALILRNAIDEYSNDLDSVLSLTDTNETKLKAIIWPEDIRYDDAIGRFNRWKSECDRQLVIMRTALH